MGLVCISFEVVVSEATFETCVTWLRWLVNRRGHPIHVMTDIGNNMLPRAHLHHDLVDEDVDLCLGSFPFRSVFLYGRWDVVYEKVRVTSLLERLFKEAKLGGDRL